MAKEKEKKLFVLDTNVIVHNFNCIYNFQEHDIDILTTVLEELDRFKKGNETMNVNVREFHRILDTFRSVTAIQTIGKKPNAIEKTVSALFHGGVALGEKLGKIQIKSVPRKLHQKIKEMFFDETPDHRILSAVFTIQEEEKKGQKRRVILVTKDINLRLKATAIGIEVEDYQHDKIPNVDHLYMGKGVIEGNGIEALITSMYTHTKAPIHEQPYSDSLPKDMKPNMYFVLREGSRSCLVRVDEELQNFHLVTKRTVFNITPRNAEQAFAVDALMQKKIDLISFQGKAGTGKTLLAMAAALEQLKEGIYDKIIIAAAMIPLSNRDIGALPGDEKEKVSPYMQGLYDNLAFIQSQYKGKKIAVTVEEQPEPQPRKRKNQQKPPTEEKVDFISALQKEGKIKIQALASIRGRSFNNTFFIIDEAQNLTPHEVKTIVTRAGENTKVVFCGDVQQIDSPYLDARSNGLSHLIYRMAGQKIMAHVTLEKGERSKLAELAADLL